jgi:hypothetical protein
MEDPRRAEKEKLGFLGMKHTLQRTRRVRVACQDSRPAGSGIGPELILA